MFIIAGFGLALDQATKALAVAFLDPNNPIPLLGGLISLHLIRNPGAAFSMGENITVVFAVVALAALVAVFAWLLPRIHHRGWAVLTGFLIAGIAGNLCDRIFREPSPFQGHVVDFIQVQYFAIFNVADMFVTAAAALVVWFGLIKQVGPDGSTLKDRPGVDG
ncbi:MAG TPA: signal peptidase II [Propionicimonas sp.]|nr:signal peptidase II [Propionicimonas sp.]